MRIYNKAINLNEMTRSGKKRISTDKIIICPYIHTNIIEYLNSLSMQDYEYLSYNFVINKNGKIESVVPQDEISYSSSSIKLNLKSISIGIYIKDKCKPINQKQKISLVSLLKKLCREYKLNYKKDIILLYDEINTREFSYYIDNYFLFQELLLRLNNVM